MSGEKKESEIRDILNKIVEGKINANRRYIDEVLEKIQDQNYGYFLDRMVIEITQMGSERKGGQSASRIST